MKNFTRYLRNMIVFMILSSMMFFPSPASAAGSVAYEQAPNHAGGFLSDGLTTTVADEFQFSQRTLITSIIWWGGYASNTSFPPGDLFTIRLYTDNGGQPGTVLQTFNVGNNTFEIVTGNWVIPPNGDRPGRPEFQYSFDLPTGFLAEPNTRYWLSIVNPILSDEWLWERSSSSLYPDVQRSSESSESGPWGPETIGPANTAFQLQSSALPVGIDIKPGAFPNSISLRLGTKISVAILSSPGFNATNQVDTETLTFGRTGNEDSFLSCSSPQDVNGDGLSDLVCSFSKPAAGFQVGDTLGILKGQTVNGEPLIGFDSVRITF